MTINIKKLRERAAVIALLIKLPSQTLIGINEVSVLLGVSAETVRRARNRNPELIPSPLSNSSLLRWRLGDILKSIEQQPTKDKYKD